MYKLLDRKFNYTKFEFMESNYILFKAVELLKLSVLDSTNYW